MKVYLLKNDPRNYKTLNYNKYKRAFQTKDKALLTRLRNDPMESKGLSDLWVNEQAQFSQMYSSAIHTPDISVWGTFLLLNEKAHAILKDRLINDVEFLPITVDGKAFTFANVLSFGKENMAKTKFNTENDDLKILVFDEENIHEKLVFKSKKEGCLNLFASQELMQICQQHGLNGMVFDENLVNFFID